MQTTSPTNTRLFIVGCSRSGTTIVQNAVVNHFDLQSFPETDFFGLLFGNPLWRTLGRFGLVRPDRSLRAIQSAKHAFGNPSLGSTPSPRPTNRTHTAVRSFLDMADESAARAGKTGWVEKTPKHFRYIEEIETFVDGACFIHVVRNGRDVVASIKDRASRYPEQFPKQSKINYGIKLWNRSVQTALKRSRKANDIVLFYEDFVRSPETELTKIAQKLQLSRIPERPAGAPTKVEIVKPNEEWKQGYDEEISKRQSKFEAALTQEEQYTAAQNLDWKSYETLRRSVLNG